MPAKHSLRSAGKRQFLPMPVVMKITKNYVARIIKKEDVKPMLSVFPEIQEEQEKAM